MSHRTLMFAALALGACTKDPPEVVMVAAETPPPAIVAECDDARDPRWQELPDRDARRSDGVRQHDSNKDRMRELKALRRTCAASLAAQFGGFPTPSAKEGS